MNTKDSIVLFEHQNMFDHHLPYRPEHLKRFTNIIFHVNTCIEKDALFIKMTK